MIFSQPQSSASQVDILMPIFLPKCDVLQLKSVGLKDITQMIIGHLFVWSGIVCVSKTDLKLTES
jgi:hypothetical protein